MSASNSNRRSSSSRKKMSNRPPMAIRRLDYFACIGRPRWSSSFFVLLPWCVRMLISIIFYLHDRQFDGIALTYCAQTCSPTGTQCIRHIVSVGGIAAHAKPSKFTLCVCDCERATSFKALPNLCVRVQPRNVVPYGTVRVNRRIKTEEQWQAGRRKKWTTKRHEPTEHCMASIGLPNFRLIKSNAKLRNFHYNCSTTRHRHAFNAIIGAN